MQSFPVVETSEKYETSTSSQGSDLDSRAIFEKFNSETIEQNIHYIVKIDFLKIIFYILVYLCN